MQINFSKHLKGPSRKYLSDLQRFIQSTFWFKKKWSQKVIKETKAEVAHFKTPFIQKKLTLRALNTNQNTANTKLAIDQM